MAKTPRRVPKDDEGPHPSAIVVSIKNAGRLTGKSRSHIYRKIWAGRYVSYRDGGRRMVTVDSIKADIARCCTELSYSQAKKLLREPQADPASA
jgi:hypothetical protein